MNVAKRSKVIVRHAFLVEITAFWGTNAVLFNSLTSAFAWQVQHCEVVWPDVVGVLLACACLRAEAFVWTGFFTYIYILYIYIR